MLEKFYSFLNFVIDSKFIVSVDNKLSLTICVLKKPQMC